MDLMNNFLSNMEHLFTSSFMADINILVNGETFKAHKLILSLQNTVFRKMLEKDMAESCTGIIQIKDVDTNAFKSFLKYIYSGKIDEMSLNKELLMIADRFLDSFLKTSCSESLKNSIMPINAAEMLMIGLKYRCDDLKNAAAECICANFNAVKNTDMFNEIFKDKDAVGTIFEKFDNHNNNMIFPEISNIKINWIENTGPHCQYRCGYFERNKKYVYIISNGKNQIKAWELNIGHIRISNHCEYEFVLRINGEMKPQKKYVQLKIIWKDESGGLTSEKKELSISPVKMFSYPVEIISRYVTNNELELQIITESQV